MVGSKFLEGRAAILLAADTLSLGAAGFLTVRLAINPFTPTVNTVLADFTEATYTGYAAITTSIAGATVITDPLTGDRLLVIPPPAGGFIYTCTAAPSPSQSVYGYYCQLAAAGLNYLFSARFPDPEVIAAIGDSVTLDSLELRMVSGFLSH